MISNVSWREFYKIRYSITSETPPLLAVWVQEPGAPVQVVHVTRSAAPVDSRFLSPYKILNY